MVTKQVDLWRDETTSVTLDLEESNGNDPLLATQLHIKKQTESLSIYLDELKVPVAALSPDKTKIIAWAAALNFEPEQRRICTSALLELNEALQRVGIAGSVLGLKSVGGVRVSFSASIQLDMGDGPSAVQPLIRIEGKTTATLSFQSTIFSAAQGADFLMELVLDRKGTLTLGMSLAVSGEPPVSWSVSDVRLPDLTLPTSFKADFQFLRLPFGGGVPVTFDFQVGQPTVALTISAGNLGISANALGTTEVKLKGNSLLTVDDLNFSLDSNGASLSASNVEANTITLKLDDSERGDLIDGLNVLLSEREMQVICTYQNGNQLNIDVTYAVGRMLIHSKRDPNVFLALRVALQVVLENGVVKPTLQELQVIEPYSVALVQQTAQMIEDGARRLLSIFQQFNTGDPQLPAVLRRMGALLAEVLAWLAQQGGAALSALAGLAESVLSVLAGFLEALANAAQSVGHFVVVEARIDTARWRLVQLIVSPADTTSATGMFTKTVLGFKIDIPKAFTPALVLDLEAGWSALAVVPDQAASNSLLISTNLWLEPPSPGQPSAPVTGREKTQAPEPLMSLRATPASDIALVVAGLQHGRAFFFKKLTGAAAQDVPLAGGVLISAGSLILARPFHAPESLVLNDVTFDGAFDKDRVLSLFGHKDVSRTDGANQPGDSFNLDQYIQVTNSTFSNHPDQHEVQAALDLSIHLLRTELTTTVTLRLNVETLRARLEGGKIGILLPQGKREIELLGLKGTFEAKGGAVAESPHLWMDLSGGDARLKFNDESYRLQLSYEQLSSSGSGLQFLVDRFEVSRDGLDLDARVLPDEVVTLAGVDMPFRFDQGGLSVRRSRIQTFALTGHGNLPPALVGDAKATITLNFCQGPDGLVLQAAEAVLDKSADPLRCEGTQFTITVSKLGLRFVRQGGYHFYFTLTGSAEFRPSSNAFAGGLLQSLSGLKIDLNEVPLASDMSVLAQHIDFLVTVDPPKRTSLFELFSFEVRGIGLFPATTMFDDRPPALAISGQVNFTEIGDLVSPKFDFHQLWIAPPKTGGVLPRVRFDGLGVGLALGSMAEITGTAIAVDGQLPTLYAPKAKDNERRNAVTGKGFLASGSLRVQGWAPMSAAMGFLELSRPDKAGKRLAFFVYVQQNDLSEEIPTPIGTFYLREVGYGLGYRYTLAGLQAADQAERPMELVALLDEVSRYQGSLDDIKAWRPTFDNAALTLAMRGLFSMTSASTSSQYNAEKEKDLPNMVLFDVVAALRSDLTFLMNVRAWLAYNYADWRAARTSKASWRDNPSLTGYMYLSAPRREFLARAVYNKGADIGEHPKLPEPLVKAMKAVRWSSTLYIRPGLFHMELGWPYQLGFDLGKPDDTFYLKVEGGTVLRYEDSAVLYGMALRARGVVKFEQEKGGSFGGAVSARAEFALAAKLIAYLSSRVTDSMFYGVLALDVTVRFTVRLWLRKKWLSLSTSFSQSLTIHVGIELLMEPAGIAAKVEASVSVRAFGRGLTIGIGFPLGDQSRLAEARSRSQRFLTLGLAGGDPDRQAGMAAVGSASAAPPVATAPQVEPPRGVGAAEADKVVEEAAELQDATSQQSTPYTKTPGVVHFWAISFPIRGTGDAYHLVQLIPRDEDSASTHFYASPTSDLQSPNYELSGVQAGEVLARPKQLVVPSGSKVLVGIDWSAPFGLEGTGPDGLGRPALRQVVADACFVEDAQKSFLDIENMAWSEEPCWLSEDPKEASLLLKKAAQSRADCGESVKALLRVEEARSCFIATVADSAEQMARMVSFQQGSAPTVGSEAERLEFDPRALGLTLVVSNSRLSDLFNDQSPSRLKVRTRVEQKTTQAGPDGWYEGTVSWFNPPSRGFHLSPPVLKAPERGNTQRARITSSGVMLHWDLAWRFRTGQSKRDDPEFYLKHYRIERRIEGLKLDDGIRPPPPKSFEVKKSDHILFVRDKWGVVPVQKQRIASTLQFADDLSDLPADLRAALLSPAVAEDRRNGQEGAKYLTDSTKLVYRILPVDCGGHSDRMGTGLDVKIAKPELTQSGLARAVARFSYERMPSAEHDALPESFLQLSIEQAMPSKLPASFPRLQLRIRSEATVPVGVFGADALTQAKSEPPLPAREARQPSAGDRDVFLEPASPKPSGPVTVVIVNWRWVGQDLSPEEVEQVTTSHVEYAITKAHWSALLEQMDVGPSPNVRAARLYLRPAPLSGTPPRLDAEWVPVQLQLQVFAGSTQAQAKPAVDITVERFEHPLATSFQPLPQRDMKATSGRLHLLHPHPRARLDTFLDRTVRTIPLPDAERRTAITLAWRSRPTDLLEPNQHRLIGGYDLFSLDVSAVPRERVQSMGRHVRHLGRVQRLPARERGLEPSEMGDLSRVEPLYPSDTVRNRAARSGKPRRTWYSPAESFLRWPQRVLRRSLMTLPDEVDIGRVFSRGRPTALRCALVAETGADQRLVPLLANVMVKCDDLAGCGVSIGAGGDFVSNDDGRFGVDQVRRLLLSLVWSTTPTSDSQLSAQEVAAELDQLWRDHPEVFERVSLEISWDVAAPPAAADLTKLLLPLAWAPALHPVLADVLDMAQWCLPDEHPNQQPSYRRYVPVLEGTPEVSANDLQTYLETTSEDRDPAGWGVLRMLGLAAALRLYDTDNGQFLQAPDCLTVLQSAFSRILPRYQAVASELGVPFVDILYTTDGLSSTASHFGAAASDLGQSGRLLDQALALVQLELRPVPMPLASSLPKGPDGKVAWPVRYAVLKLKANSEVPPDAQLVLQRIHSNVDGLFVEVEPAASAFTGSRSVSWLAAPTAPEESPSSLKSIKSIALPSRRPGEVLAYLRVVDPRHGADSTDFTEAVSLSLEIEVTSAGKVSHLSPETVWESARAVEAPNAAWGRFGDLPKELLDQMMCDQQSTRRIATGPAGQTLAVLTGTLSRLPGKAAMAQLPQQDDERQQLLATLATWSRRFMSHGPAVRRRDVTLSPTIAFAMLTRPNPWRLAADSAGWMRVVLLEKDRFGKLLKYAVRPFGRYEALERAVAAHEAADASRALGQMPPPPPLPVVFDDPAQLTPDALSKRFVDVVVERTEKLAPPLILATSRPNAGPTHSSSVEDVVEIIVSRHPEEVLSEANIPVDASLAMRHVALGFWREFAAPRWAEAVTQSVGVQGLNTLQAFGSESPQAPKPLELDVVDESDGQVNTGRVRAWYERHPDLWRGAQVVSVSGLPYGYRIHATAHAAAGVVVSPTTVATLGEAAYQLAWPWDSEKAMDSVEARPSWWIGEDRAVHCSWTQVRLLDGMLSGSRELWFHGQIPAVYQLPDPAVAYQVALESSDGRTQEPQVEFQALGESAADASLYQAQTLGARLKHVNISQVWNHLTPAGDLVRYGLHAALSPILETSPRTLGAHPSLKLQLDSCAPGDLVLSPGKMKFWSGIAPKAEVRITISPPLLASAKDWTDFKQVLDGYIGELRTYVNADLHADMKSAAKHIAQLIEPWSQDRVSHWPGPVNAGVAQPVSILFSDWHLGLPVPSGIPNVPVKIEAPKSAWLRERLFTDQEVRDDYWRSDFRQEIRKELGTVIQADATQKTLRAYAKDVMLHRAEARRCADLVEEKGRDEPRLREALRPLRAIDLTTPNVQAKVFDVQLQLELTCQTSPEDAQIEDIVSQLLGAPGTAETVESLVAWWSAGVGVHRPERHTVLVRWSAHKQLLDALSAVGVVLHEPPNPRAATLLLVQPMTQKECQSMGQVCPEWEGICQTLTSTLVLGPGRRMVLRAFHGTVDPIEVEVRRGVA